MAFPCKGKLIALIGDEDSCVGFLLGGIGERNHGKNPEVNFLVVDPAATAVDEIEAHFRAFLTRGDIDIILIQQTVADQIRSVIERHQAPIPAVLEIPSKNAPYDPKKDSVLKRARGLVENRDG